MSTIDSQEIFKADRPAWSPGNRQVLPWWVTIFTGLLIAAIGFVSYVKDFPVPILTSNSWTIVGGVLFVASCVGLLDRAGVIRIWQSRRSRVLHIRLRIEAYYRKGQDLYLRLETDRSIPPDEVRKIVATEWVNPVTEYLKGTVGDRTAAEFLCIAQTCEPDQQSVQALGYAKALARVRLLDRLNRLRTTLLDLR